MCRMLAFASDVPMEIAPYLAHLARLSARGNLVDRWERRPGGNHPDGWGIAYRQEGETLVIRSGGPASSDPELAGIRASTDRFLGHARYASDTDTVNAANAHPFSERGISLAHNGTFRGRIGEEAERRKVSDTLVFLELLADVWMERTLSGLGAALSPLLGNHDLVGEYSAANFLILAGETLYALRKFRKDEEYYTLFLRSGPGLVAVASEPLDATDRWRPLENGELVELRFPSPRSVFLAPAA